MRVRWNRGGESNSYRIGYEGAIDLIVVTSSSSASSDSMSLAAPTAPGRIPVGSFVALSPSYVTEDDAAEGPLTPYDIGIVPRCLFPIPSSSSSAVVLTLLFV